MAKDKIIFPDRFHFQTTIEIRTSDLNYGGHLGHAQFFEIIHEARIRFLNHYGLSEHKFYSGSLILSHASAEFKSQAFHGDVLSIKVEPENFRRTRFDLVYKVENTATGKLVALFRTEMGCFDYVKETILALPAEFVALFEDHHESKG